MKSLIFVAVVLNWSEPTKWWIIDAPTAHLCKMETLEQSLLIKAMHDEDCIKVTPERLDWMKQMIVQWKP